MTELPELPEKKLRMTRQREIILEELRELTSHPSADELFERVRKRLPRISLGTVYRNLETLSELGLLKKIEAAGRQKRFDGNTCPHSHIRCTRCGRIEDMHTEEMTNALLPGPDDLRGYELTGFHVEFHGICPECRKCGQ